jgi:hypothetical protein
MTTLIIAGIVALVVVYMTYPRFLRRRVSSARFFRDLPPPRRQARFRLGKLQLNLLFFLQLLIFLSVLAAVFFSDIKLSGSERRGMGVWFIVDTSASMSTVQQGEPRMAAAVKEVEQAIPKVRQAAKNKPVCFRLSTFDLERRDLVPEGDGFVVLQAMKSLEPRPLGTDLGIIRRLFQVIGAESQPQTQCRVSHLVVVTDNPAPGWPWENNEIEVVWRDIGKPVDNLGFTNIRASRNPLTGLVSEVQIEATAYGWFPANAKLSITTPDGTDIKNQVLDWQQGQGLVRTWQGSFTPSGPGQYRMTLSPGGAYVFDDTAVIAIDHGYDIRVDWQLRDRRLPRQMGWIEDRVNPHLRVTSKPAGPMNIPTLIVGPGYRVMSGNSTPVVIRDFMEASALLTDVNLDAVETLELKGTELPGGFQPVLRGMDGGMWLAQAENPLRAYVPGLPTGTDDVIGRFSATVFFNALRWLLKERPLNPLYTLTSPYALDTGANRLVLHKDEGNTQQASRSLGRLQDLRPIAGKGTAIPLWPILLMAAAVLFLIERTMAAYTKSSATSKSL